MGQMAVWDDSEEEQANVVLMACAEALAETIKPESKSESDSEEVFSDFLVLSLNLVYQNFWKNIIIFGQI